MADVSSSSSLEYSSSSSSSYVENWSSSSISTSSSSSMSSSSSSSMQFFDQKTIPFILETDESGPVFSLLSTENYLYSGTIDGTVLRSNTKYSWEKYYTCDDSFVTALFFYEGYLFIGTSPQGKLYVIDAVDSSIYSTNVLNCGIKDFVLYGDKVYVLTEYSANVYCYNFDDKSLKLIYETYGSRGYKLLVHQSKMYVFINQSNVLSFDGTLWKKISLDTTTASYRNVSNVNSSIFGGEVLFPINKDVGISSAAFDGDYLIVGSDTWGRIYGLETE